MSNSSQNIVPSPEEHSPLPDRTAEARMSTSGFYTIVTLVILLDQAVKYWVRNSLALGETIPLWPGVFQITYTQNRGMAFSLLEGAVSFLVLAALIVSFGIIYIHWKNRARMSWLTGLSLALALGGAVGNLIDRIWLKYVTDLFDFRLINFPIFNVADSAITVGIALLAWRILSVRETPAPASAERSETGAESAADPIP